MHRETRQRQTGGKERRRQGGTGELNQTDTQKAKGR